MGISNNSTAQSPVTNKTYGALIIEWYRANFSRDTD